jgi:hypothetical protein
MTATQKVSDGMRISRSDIESKLREIRGEVDAVGESSKTIALAAGAAVCVAVVSLAYFMGKRKGKRKTTVVEVRRV